MRHLLSIILAAVVLVAVVTGCDGLRRYDVRLVAADSLMHDHPDSALALVQAIELGSLTRERDRAYRDLLLTQGRYRSYVTATSDSDINRALAYYLAHDGEREKLTRAYLYKGAVMEELGHPDSAMLYYKHAEATAAPNDYFNLGQTNIRIGNLYRKYYADMLVCYDKYKQALHYYRLAGDKSLQLVCMLNMGGCSAITHNDSSVELLNEASSLALELNDSTGYYQSQELLCRQLSFEGKAISRAKSIALHCLNDYRSFVTNDLLLDLANIYTYSSMHDSAMHYLNLVNENSSIRNRGQIKTRKYLTLSLIARLEGDTALSNHYDRMGHQVSDSIINNKHKYQIQQIENLDNHNQHNRTQLSVSRLKWTIWGISIIAVLSIALTMMVYVRRLSKTKAIIRELENMKLDNHDNLLNQLDDRNGVIGRLLNNLIELMKSCASDVGSHNSTSQMAQQIKENIHDVANDDFWNELKSYLDKNHNGIISRFSTISNITEKDIRFIMLSCCEFSYVEIAIIMNYSPKYISNKRKIIARKLGVEGMALQDYLNSMMK